MTDHAHFVRNTIGVVGAIAAVTAVGLVLGQRRAPLPAYDPPPPPPKTARLPEELGAELFSTKGCVACHSVDGSARVGPSLAKRWGSTVTLAAGRTVIFDEAYVRESLALPQAKAQSGYPPSMPSFDGLLKEREIAALVAYLQTR